MSDKQPPLWNIRSSDDDDYPATGRSGSSSPFYHSDDDEVDEDAYLEDEEEAEEQDSSSRSKTTYGSGAYGSGANAYGSSSRYSPGGYGSSQDSARSSSSYGSSGSSSSYRPGGSSSYSGSGYTPPGGRRDQEQSGSKPSGLLNRFGSGNETSRQPSPAPKARSGPGLGERLSGGLKALRRKLPGGDRPSSGSSRASVTRTIGPAPTGQKQAGSGRKEDGGRFKFSWPFGLGGEKKAGRSGQPSAPKGLKKSRPLPSTSKRPRIKNEGLSLDRKLDLAGWAMIVLAGIIFFGAISANQGDLSRTLLRIVYQLVGIGWIAVPLSLAATGIWLVWRHFGESVPEVDYVHVVGWGITYLAALTTFHFVHLLNVSVFTVDQLQTLAEEAAQAGYGGGWLGAQIYLLLMRSLGDIGTFIALVGWWGIGILVATDLSVAGIIRFFSRTWRNAVLRYQNRRARQASSRWVTPLRARTGEVDELPGGAATVLEAGDARPALPAAESLPLRTGGQPRHSGDLAAVDAPAAGASISARPVNATAATGPLPAELVPEEPVTLQYGMGPVRIRRPQYDRRSAPPASDFAGSPPDEIGDAPAAALHATASPLESESRPAIPPAVRLPRPTTSAQDISRSLRVIAPPPAERPAASAPPVSPPQPADEDRPVADENSVVGARTGNEQPIQAEPAIAPVSAPEPHTGEEHSGQPADAHDEAPPVEDLPPAQPRSTARRVLRPLRPPSDARLAFERVTSMPGNRSPVSAEPDDTAEDEPDYEDLPDADLLPTDSDVPVIEIDDPAEEMTPAPPAASESPASTLPAPRSTASFAQRPVPPAVRPAPSPATPTRQPITISRPAPPDDLEHSTQLPDPPRTTAWQLPDFRQILDPATEQHINDEVLLERARIIEDTLASFGAPGKVVEVNPGPVITQFGVEPDYIESRGGRRTRVKVQAIARLADDLALSLAARSIRIEAPVPGKGFVGIEVPNSETSLVSLRDIMESQELNRIDSTLRIGLGQSVDGTPVAADLTAMPHLLIAGTTGSGKSVCVNAIIACLLFQNTPDDLRMIMVDPKRVELTGYNGIPHLVAPVVVELERIVGVLKWVTREMDDRYRKFNERGARNIVAYNKMLKPGEKRLPYLVVIVDELADLMMLAPDETERVLTRLAQMARATGIHLIISTQRPSVDVVTGLIKANFPARIAFAVASSVDSRVILDQPGAERLLGRGDMLFQAPDAAAPVRLQGVFVSDAELTRLVNHWKGIHTPESTAEPAGRPAVAPRITGATFTAPKEESPPARSFPQRESHTPLASHPSSAAFWEADVSTAGTRSRSADDVDDMYDQAVEVVRRLKKASVSLLQRQLRIGYTRAARLIDVMEERGVVGPAQSGSKPRKVIGYSDDDVDLEEDEEADEADLPAGNRLAPDDDSEADDRYAAEDELEYEDLDEFDESFDEEDDI